MNPETVYFEALLNLKNVPVGDDLRRKDRYKKVISAEVMMKREFGALADKKIREIYLKVFK